MINGKKLNRTFWASFGAFIVISFATIVHIESDLDEISKAIVVYIAWGLLWWLLYKNWRD